MNSLGVTSDDPRHLPILVWRPALSRGLRDTLESECARCAGADVMTKFYPKGATFCELHSRGLVFRIRGYGLAIVKDSPVLFSERYGYMKSLRIGRWVARVLKP